MFRVDKWPQGFASAAGGIDWNRIAKRPALNVDDKRALAEHCPSVLRTAASSWQPAQKVRTANAETGASVFIIGATNEYPDTAGAPIATGRFFNESEEVDGRRVAVLGPDVADKLFPSIDPIPAKRYG